MKWIGVLVVSAWMAMAGPSINAPQPGKEVALFNGKDLSGWHKNGDE